MDPVLGRGRPSDAPGMTVRAWRERLRAVLARRRAERELSEELEFHLAMQARKHVERGNEMRTTPRPSRGANSAT